MKILGLLILFSAPMAFASNPLIRICNLTGGVFHEVKTANDQVGFCQYGSALMDALSIFNVTSNHVKNSAVVAIESNNANSCEEAGAQLVQAEDLEAQRFELCVFQDQSMIELSTLKNGASAASNAELMQALKIRF